MDGREFLAAARDAIAGASEAHWRTACGRAYYALMLECRDVLERWGIPVLPHDVHSYVRFRFEFVAHADLKAIGIQLDLLGQLRAKADYHIRPFTAFTTEVRALDAIQEASDAIGLLDEIDDDPVRQAAAVAAIRAKYP